MGPPQGDRTEGLGVRFLSLGTGHGMCQPWKGRENGVAACSMVVLNSGISKWLWNAFCSFSPSERGVIKYTVYVGRLGKCVPRQQEASGNHPSTHSVALGHVFLG